MQTRTADEGPGMHQAHWRETTTAGFFRMKTTSHDEDPHSELPRCFADRRQMQGLLSGTAETSTESVPSELSTDAEVKWRPEVLFRTCLASRESSERFGPMMADAREFFFCPASFIFGRRLVLQPVDSKEALSDLYADC